MPHAVICIRCGAIVRDLEHAHGIERYSYSTRRGVPRKQTFDDYLCPECNEAFNDFMMGAISAEERGTEQDTTAL